jgi:hypothetical protein
MQRQSLLLARQWSAWRAEMRIKQQVLDYSTLRAEVCD